METNSTPIQPDSQHTCGECVCCDAGLIVGRFICLAQDLYTEVEDTDPACDDFMLLNTPNTGANK